MNRYATRNHRNIQYATRNQRTDDTSVIVWSLSCDARKGAVDSATITLTYHGKDARIRILPNGDIVAGAMNRNGKYETCSYTYNQVVRHDAAHNIVKWCAILLCGYETGARLNIRSVETAF